MVAARLITSCGVRKRYLLVALLFGCGRLGFGSADQDAPTADASIADAPSADAPSVPFVPAPVVVVSTGSIEGVSGRPTQSHLVFAAASETWWLFYIDDTTDVLRSTYSPDLVSWTPSTTLQLAYPLVAGTNFSVATKVLGGNDVVHVALAYTTAIERHDHLRGVLSATTIAWDAPTMVGCATTISSGAEDGPVTVIADDDRVYDFTSAYEDNDSCTNSNSTGNFDVTASGTPDTGAVWTPTWNTHLQLAFCVGQVTAHWGAPLPDDQVLTVQTNGLNGSAEANLNDLWWATGAGGTWSAKASVFPAPLATSVGANDWGAVQVTPNDVQIVVRLDDGTFRCFRFDGTAWTEIAAPLAQGSNANSGPFLATDGTRTYLFVIDADAASTIRVASFDGAAWSGWTAVETSAQTRSYLSGVSTVTNGRATLLWTEARGATFDLVTETVPL